MEWDSMHFRRSALNEGGGKGYWCAFGPGSEQVYGPFDTLEAAREKAAQLATYGARVIGPNGNAVWYAGTPLQADILSTAKLVTDYCRANGFTYGDAPINPGIDHTAHIVSCDRLVCWVLYRLGFTDQPVKQGVCVQDMEVWCTAQHFERIGSVEALQPGDIVLVNPNEQGVPKHTFLFAGRSENPSLYYRYDCGMQKRIESVQPFCEPIEKFMFAFRPRRA